MTGLADRGFEHYSEGDNGLQKVELLFDLKRYPEAEQAIRQHLIDDPEDVFLLYSLARAEYLQDKFKEAETSLFNCLVNDPNYGWGYYLLSHVNHQLLNFDHELKHALKSVELEPDEPVFLERLSQAYLQSGEVHRAKIILEEVIKIEPDASRHYEMLGDISFQLGDYSSAENAYRDALKFDPEDTALLNDLARSLLEQRGKTREAIDVFYNIIQLEPTNSLAAKNLFISINTWLDNNSFKGRWIKAKKELPESLQYFYDDYKKRTSIFEAWGKFVWTFIWIVVLGGLTWFFSLIRP